MAAGRDTAMPCPYLTRQAGIPPSKAVLGLAAG